MKVYNILLFSALLMPFSILYKFEIFNFKISWHYIPLFILLLIEAVAILKRLILKSLNSKEKYILGCLVLLMCYPLINGFLLNSIWVSIFFFIIIVGFVDGEVNLYGKSIFQTFLILMIVAVGYWQLYFNVPLFDPEYAGSDIYFADENGFFRATSVFLNPNAFAYWLVLQMLCFSFFVKNYRKINWLIFMGLLFYLLIKTDSRSALISCFLILLILINRYLKNRFLIWTFPLLSLLSIAVVILVVNYWEAFSWVDVRFVKWYIGYESWVGDFNYILFGVPHEIELVRDDITFSDNMFLHLLYRYGLLYMCVVTLGWFYMQIIAGRVILYSNCKKRILTSVACLSTLPMFWLSDFVYFYPISLFYALIIGAVIRNYVNMNDGKVK